MRNIIIFSDETTKEEVEKIELMLKDNLEVDVRVKNIEEFKDAVKFNPSVIIIDGEEKRMNELGMVTKLSAPTIGIVTKITSSQKFRGNSFDLIERPINKYSLFLKIKNMLKIKELEENLKIASSRDELTGLYNRKFLHERLDQEMSRAKRYDTKLSCLLFDIDYFKVINDMYGYEWGDVLLKKISELFTNFIRKEDILTRYGDEEFLVILPNSDEEQAFMFAERFRRTIEKLEFIPSGEKDAHRVTISGGISSYPFLENVEETGNTLIRYAEHALYNAKHRGRNRIVQFSQVNIEM